MNRLCSSLLLRALLPHLFLAAADLVAESLEDLASRVVIVANENSRGSVRIAEHYAERRGVPRENIIRLNAPDAETITREQFITTIHNPLHKKLFEGDWLEGLFSELTVEDGRYRSLISGHRISYLILCRGIPLRIEDDPSLVTPRMRQQAPAEFLTSAASVDSEVALMTGILPVVAFVPNPLFEKKEPSESDRMKVIKVARLDGPTVASAMSLVDHAIAGEKSGLRGRAYVDLTGPHQDGDDWLRATAAVIERLGFDLERHDAKGVFPAIARFDAPALYFGWYANDATGPFTVDGFFFPPGAIALHIHSFSARTARRANQGWIGPLVERGVAVTLGNVYEPYLQYTHRPHHFLERLADGATVGDAAAYAISALSWQGVLIGDPLYRPFARPLEQQLTAGGNGDESDEDRLAGYAVIRRMNLGLREGEGKAAVDAAETFLRDHPHWALAVAVAKAREAEGERRAARLVLERFLDDMPQPAVMEILVAREAADLLATLGERKKALKVYEAVLESETAPDVLRSVVLRSGVELAQRAGDSKRARKWRTELDRLQTVGR